LKRHCWNGESTTPEINILSAQTKKKPVISLCILDTGLDILKIPKDGDYLKSILPELERLKTSTLKVIDSHLEGIRSAKVRRNLKRLLWRRTISVE
jgi:hypothetical protein